MSRLILASGSATRQRLLRNAGVQFVVEAAQVDEDGLLEALRAEKAKARDAADMLAELKALKTGSRHQGAWVIGADQVLGLDGDYLQKPGSLEGAKAQLKRLRGREHELASAVCVVRGGAVVWRHVGQARLQMRDFSDAFLDQYLVDAGEGILGSVGAYHVEGLGLQLFSRIDGDTFTIQGLPLLPLLDFLRLNGLVAT